MKLLKKSNFQNGAAAVEMAIIISILMTLIFGIIEFCLLLYDKAMITHAAREGARLGVMWAPSLNGTSYLATKTDIENEIKKWLDKDLISGSSDAAMVDINPDTTTPCGDPDSPLLTVTVTYTYSFFVLPDLLEKKISNLLNLSSQASMVCEK